VCCRCERDVRGDAWGRHCPDCSHGKCESCPDNFRQYEKQRDYSPSYRHTVSASSSAEVEGIAGENWPAKKDQEEKDRLQTKHEHKEWKSQAEDDTGRDQDLHQSPRQQKILQTWDGSDLVGQVGVPLFNRTMMRYLTEDLRVAPGSDDESIHENKTGEGFEVSPVSDDKSIHESKFYEGQPYFDINANHINEADKDMAFQFRQWNDVPSYRYAVDTNLQPPTANDAIKKFEHMADDISVISRAATWGSRRQSDSSLSNIPTVNNGNFLDQVSTDKGKEKKPVQLSAYSKNQFNIEIGPLAGNLQGPKLELEQNPVDKDSLASPHMDAGVDSMTSGHVRPGSVSGWSAESTDTHLAFARSDIKRARGEGSYESSESLKLLGGLPATTLTRLAYPIKDITPDNSNQDDYEDEEDEWSSRTELSDDESAVSVDPATLSAFVKHIQQLNPKIESGYLLNRIAHNHFIRYHKLLQSRTRHENAVAAGTCMSGPKCIASNNSDSNTSSLDGSLQHEDFPRGVPIPSAESLPAEFECQLCFRVREFLYPSDWTHHVYEDVQPFTCTFPNCQVTTSFGREASWILHENQEHRHLECVWICNIEDCTETFFRIQSFARHMVSKHSVRNPKTREAKMRSCQHYTSNEPQDEPCKFCGKRFTSWKNLIIHLANHMKRISLSVLNLVCQQPTNESRTIGPVEPVSQPSTASPPSQEHSFRSGDSAYFSQTPQSSNQHISPNIHTLLASPEVYMDSPTVEVDQAIHTKGSSPGPNSYCRITKSFAAPTVEDRGLAVATAAQSGTMSRDTWIQEQLFWQLEQDIGIWDYGDPHQ
jgi:hypothetical protein